VADPDWNKPSPVQSSPLEHKSAELHDLNYPKKFLLFYELNLRHQNYFWGGGGSGMLPPTKGKMCAACVHTFGVERYATRYLSASFLQNSGTNKVIQTHTHTHIRARTHFI
jgi:hypothetical protein